MDILTAFSKCLSDLSLAKNTARVYKNGLDRFAEFLDEQTIETSRPVDILKIEYFIAFMPWLDRRYSKQTAGVYNAAVKALLDFLVIDGVIQVDYASGVRFKKAATRSHRRHQDKLPRWPNKDDVQKMLSAVREYTEISPRKERNIALLEFLASSGCRINEVMSLNIKDIDLKNRSSVVTGKGEKDRRVFFSDDTARALALYWEVRKSNKATDPAFGRHDRGAGHKRIKRLTTAGARNIVKEIAMVAGIDSTKFSPHYFRHAFAIRVLSETGNLALAQDLLGHTDPKSTRVYAKIDSEDLQKAHHSIFLIHNPGTYNVKGFPNTGILLHMFEPQLPITLDLSFMSTKSLSSNAHMNIPRDPKLADQVQKTIGLFEDVSPIRSDVFAAMMESEIYISEDTS